MTSKMLLEQYMAERHALGFSLKTDEGCIRRFLRDFAEPDDGVISFTKEYILNHIGNRLNVQTNTILRDVSAINGFLDFVIRKGYTAYKIPPKSLPKENRNFRAYIFTDDEIERILIAADYVPLRSRTLLESTRFLLYSVSYSIVGCELLNYLNYVCAMWISKKMCLPY